MHSRRDCELATPKPIDGIATRRHPKPPVEEDQSSNRSSTPSLVSSPGHSRNSSSSVLDGHIGINKNALSDAIVASSLASTHAPQRAEPSPPPTPPRRGIVRSLLHPRHLSIHTHLSKSDHHHQPPSPSKGLPRTLRTRHPQEDEETECSHKHRKHIIHHPHKHHEGDKKRWRIEITERERKRYEGVWAANKGLLIPTGEFDKQSPYSSDPILRYPPNASEMVLNFVVRDIWTRSCLPQETLEQIWDLVDHQDIGLLTREEFVVGMWLIDQQLKGHKLPTRVPESVWDSVRHTPGIKPPE